MEKSVYNTVPPRQKHLKGRLIKYFAGTVVGVLVAVIVIVSVILIPDLKNELKTTLSSKSEHVLQGMERRISYVVDTINNFSNNHFIINSLIHPHNREQYLYKMVDDFSKLEGIDSVTVLDYSGSLVYSSLSAPPNYQKILYLRPTLETGKSIITLSRDQTKIVIMEPIHHYQTPIGVVIAEIKLEDLVSRVMIQDDEGYYKFYSLNELLVSDNFNETETYIVVVGTADKSTPYLNTFQAKLELGKLESKHMKPVLTLVYKLLVVSGIFILLSIVLSIKIGNSLARPILNMVQKTTQTGSSEIQHYSPIGTGDELEILAQALDDREAKLRGFRQQLEEMVDERTRDLTNTEERLKQTIKELKIAHEISEKRAAELETFSYSVSHDLKAPLRGMDGYSRLLLENYADHLDEEGHYFLKMIVESTAKMSQLIEDLLFYARIEEIDSNVEEIDLEEVFSALERDNQQALAGFVTEINLSVKRIVSNREGLEHALKNIFENAIKFCGDNSRPKITVNCYEDKGQWVIIIEDNGIGFDMKYHDRIFNIFKRLERNEEYPGTGVGLAIVKRIADRLGGRVWAESMPSRGTSFHVALPIRRLR